MKFLCLHGAIGNTHIFKAQLDPLIAELESDGTASFVFIQGPVQIYPKEGFSDYFGPGPHWKWLNDEDAEAGFLELIRELPPGETGEDKMRELAKQGQHLQKAAEESMDFLQVEIDKHPDATGIIGYSEGAMVAATFLLEQQRRKNEKLKVGVFFVGWPALDARTGRLMLADETEERVGVPSVHVVGGTDPYLDAAITLYDMFDEDTAVFFDHARGHNIPREKQTVKELADVIRQAIAQSQKSE